MSIIANAEIVQSIPNMEVRSFSIKESEPNIYDFTIESDYGMAMVKMTEEDIYDLIELLEATVEKFHI